MPRLENQFESLPQPNRNPNATLEVLPLKLDDFMCAFVTDRIGKGAIIQARHRSLADHVQGVSHVLKIVVVPSVSDERPDSCIPSANIVFDLLDELRTRPEMRIPNGNISVP